MNRGAAGSGRNLSLAPLFLTQLVNSDCDERQSKGGESEMRFTEVCPEEFVE